MNPQHAWLYLGMITVVVACGGGVHKNDSASGSAGSSTGGGAGEAGAAARGGSMSAGAGASTAGGSSSGAGNNCAEVDCPLPACNDDEAPARPPWGCCPTCEPRGSCEDVRCEPVEVCGEDYELTQPPGACCVGCMPKSVTFCNEIECLTSNCRPGYVPEDRLGGCGCGCVPDPLYCRDDTDCVMVDKPRACCGCPEAISWRQYEVEACWSQVASPRPLPQACYPEVTCDALCAPCPEPREAAECSEGRCVARPEIPK